MVAFISVLALFLMLPFVMSINQTATQARLTTEMLKKQITHRYILEGGLEYALAWLARQRDDATTEWVHFPMPLGGQRYLIDLRQARQHLKEGGLEKQQAKQNDKQKKESGVSGQEVIVKSARKSARRRFVKLEAVVRNANGFKIGTIRATIERTFGLESHQATLLSYNCVPDSHK